MGTKIIYGIFAALLFISCGGYDYDDYYYRNESYKQVVRFGDTNRVIKEINYYRGLQIDSPNTGRTTLKLSPYETTKFTISDGVKNYEFEVQMKFKLKPKNNNDEKNSFEKIYEGLEILKSNASSTKIIRATLQEKNSNYYYYSNYLIVDSLIIE
jgi:hypothetical protein